MAKDLVTLVEAAALLGIRPGALEQMLEQGTLTPAETTAKGAPLFTHESLEQARAWLEQDEPEVITTGDAPVKEQKFDSLFERLGAEPESSEFSELRLMSKHEGDSQVLYEEPDDGESGASNTELVLDDEDLQSGSDVNVETASSGSSSLLADEDDRESGPATVVGSGAELDELMKQPAKVKLTPPGKTPKQPVVASNDEDDNALGEDVGLLDHESSQLRGAGIGLSQDEDQVPLSESEMPSGDVRQQLDDLKTTKKSDPLPRGEAESSLFNTGPEATEPGGNQFDLFADDELDSISGIGLAPTIEDEPRAAADPDEPSMHLGSMGDYRDSEMSINLDDPTRMGGIDDRSEMSDMALNPFDGGLNAPSALPKLPEGELPEGLGMGRLETADDLSISTMDSISMSGSIQNELPGEKAIPANEVVDLDETQLGAPSLKDSNIRGSESGISIDLETGLPHNRGPRESESGSLDLADLDVGLKEPGSFDDETDLLNQIDDNPENELTVDLLPGASPKSKANTKNVEDEDLLDLADLGLPEEPTQLSEPPSSGGLVTDDDMTQDMGSSLGLGNEGVNVGAGASMISLRGESGVGSGVLGNDLLDLDQPLASGSRSGGASLINLDSADEDDNVLGSSGGGSDITLKPSESGIGIGAGESGIGLAGLGDSGIDLTKGLGGIGSGISSGIGLPGDNEFLLTPLADDGQDESDSSGSQVIALDAEGGIDDAQPTQIGSSVNTPTMLGGEDPYAQYGQQGYADPQAYAQQQYQQGYQQGYYPAQPMPGMMPDPDAAPTGIVFGTWTVLGLTTCAIFLFMGGMMMYELMRTIAVGAKAPLMEMLLNLM